VGQVIIDPEKRWREELQNITKLTCVSGSCRRVQDVLSLLKIDIMLFRLFIRLLFAFAGTGGGGTTTSDWPVIFRIDFFADVGRFSGIGGDAEFGLPPTMDKPNPEFDPVLLVGLLRGLVAPARVKLEFGSK